jgi:hypothetical protein
MSRKHPRPWTAILETTVREKHLDGKRGTVLREYWAVTDARCFFVVQGLDEETAREIAGEKEESK